MRVCAALTAPVVVFAAMGTLDGFGKMLLNLPRILEYQMRYATRVMQEGSGGEVSNHPRPHLQEQVYQALKLLVYDLGGSSGGHVSKDPLAFLRSKLDETLSY